MRAAGAEDGHRERAPVRGSIHHAVAAFPAASRGGDLDALLAMLDPDAVPRADRAAGQMGALREARGAAAVAEPSPAGVDGVAGHLLSL